MTFMSATQVKPMAKAAFTLAMAAMIALPSAASAQDWPVGSMKLGDKWSVGRVAEGCYLFQKDAGFDKTIALAATSGGDEDSVMFGDPRLAPLNSSEPLKGAKLTFNGKSVPLNGAIISNFDDPGSPPMAITMFSPSRSNAFDGKPVEVSFTAKDLTITDTIDADAATLADWRACTAEMRAGK